MTPLVDLKGKRGLVIGIANEHSIAAGCAEAFTRCGARLAATYLNDKAKDWVQPVVDQIGPGEMACARMALAPSSAAT